MSLGHGPKSTGKKSTGHASLVKRAFARVGKTMSERFDACGTIETFAQGGREESHEVRLAPMRQGLPKI